MSVAWEQKVADQTRALGFASLSDYLAHRAGVPYPELADELGPDVMGIQVADLQLRQALGAGPVEFKQAAADSLVRVFRQIIPDGWGRTEGSEEGVSPEFMNINASSHWASLIKRVGGSQALTDAVWEYLQANAPEGWLPKDTRDTVVRQAFDVSWPVEN